MYGIKRTTLETDRIFHSNGMYSILSHVDYVSPTLPPHQGNAKLICLEDNDAVIKMLIKGRTNKLRHVLFEVLREDPGVNIKYINTKDQVHIYNTTMAAFGILVQYCGKLVIA